MAILAPSLRDLRAQLNSIAPNRSKVSDGWIGNAEHAARSSRHNPNADGVVCAIDVTHDPAGGMDAWWLREALRVSGDTRIGVVISMGQIFSSTPTSARPAWTWGRYTGANGHHHHLHVDVHPGGTRAGFWNLSRDLAAPIRPPLEEPTTPEDDLPLTDADVKRVADAVWGTTIAHANVSALAQVVLIDTLRSARGVWDTTVGTEPAHVVLAAVNENAAHARLQAQIAATRDLATGVDPDQLATAIVAAVGPDLASEVVDALVARLRD